MHRPRWARVVYGGVTRTVPLAANVRSARLIPGYVNAQYRFVVKPTFDSQRHLNDPDLPLPWQDVVQVLVPLTSDAVVAAHGTAETDQAGTCPICLSPPTAPRMTRCGHVFCYACMLHYLIVAENGTRTRGSMRHAKRCPICWDDVVARDLKAVLWVDGQHEAQRHRRAFLECHTEKGLSMPDDVLILRLVERPNDACVALPRSTTWPIELGDRSLLCSHPDALLYARCVRATPEHLVESLRADIAGVEAATKEAQAYEPDELSLEFLRVAHEQLQEQLLTALGMPSMPTERPASERTAVRSSYFYFQAASGQYVFLHPIDIKVLLSRFQTYANFPDTLAVAVQGADEGTVDEALRKKCKYLAHLPMSADVTFIEVDWARTAADVPASVQPAIPWEPWADVLAQRSQRRQSKAAREEKYRKRAQKEPQKHRETNVWPEEQPLADDQLSFREAAMVGAEMYFPMHPGAAADDESLFPSMSTPAPARPTERVAKTVWGTPAASQTHSAAAPDTQHMDEAWHTLEERSGNPEQSEGKRPGPKTKRKPKLILTGGGRAAW